MDNEKNTKKSFLTAGAAIAACGAVLYGAGQLLSFLFRDVDPKRVEKQADAEPETIENEED